MLRTVDTLVKCFTYAPLDLAIKNGTQEMEDSRLAIYNSKVLLDIPNKGQICQADQLVAH